MILLPDVPLSCRANFRRTQMDVGHARIRTSVRGHTLMAAVSGLGTLQALQSTRQGLAGLLAPSPLVPPVNRILIDLRGCVLLLDDADWWTLYRECLGGAIRPAVGFLTVPSSEAAIRAHCDRLIEHGRTRLDFTNAALAGRWAGVELGPECASETQLGTPWQLRPRAPEDL